MVEFQAQYAESAWYNLLTKIGLYGEEHPKYDVRGLLIFRREHDDPRLPSGVENAHLLLAAVYLEQFLPAWLVREPDNPFVAALAPLILSRNEELRERAPVLWRTIQTAPGRATHPRRPGADFGILVF